MDHAALCLARAKYATNHAEFQTSAGYPHGDASQQDYMESELAMAGCALHICSMGSAFPVQAERIPLLPLLNVLAMKPIQIANYVKFILYPFSIFATLFWLLALLIQPVHGGLTRVGGWTENDFGWNAPQPAIKILATGKALVDPDIVVLGDSFSITSNSWQSVVSQNTGKRIQTFGYDDSGCVDNWIRWATEKSAAKTVIVEIVERNFVGVFGQLKVCGKQTPIPFEMPETLYAPTRAKWPPTLDAKYLFRAMINWVRLYFNSGTTITSGKTVNVPLKKGCAKFSNRRADRLMYYIDEDRKAGGENLLRAISYARAIQTEVERHNKKFIFVIVPDKTSVYRSCLGQTSFSDATRKLIAAGVKTPDLQDLFESKIDQIVDLYNPDGTHWNTSGYLLMGGKMVKMLAK